METIKLDLIPGKKMPSLHASQYDDGREHGIDLFENGVVYKLDGTETLTINERKGDDCICSLDIENDFADKNHIVFASTEQMCAVWGNNICELVIAKGEKIIGTLNFILEIEPSPTENGIESESEIKNLKRQIEEITEEVIGDDYYTAEQTDEAIENATEGKADKTYVDEELAKKADKTNTYTKTQVDNALNNKMDKANPRGTGSIAVGQNVVASGGSSQAFGVSSTASGAMSHAEGQNTTASGAISHAEGNYTVANHKSQHVFGEYNIPDDSEKESDRRGNYVEIVGNGTSNNARSNARTLDWQGNETLMGDLTYNGNKSLTSEISRLDNRITDLPEAMVFKGTLGVGGTIETLPTASASNEGWMFKCITAGTYAGLTLKVGDTVTCFNPPNTSTYYWDKTGSQDTDTDTWRNIKVNGIEKLGNGISSGAVDFEDTANVKFEFDANGNKVRARLNGIYTESEVDDLLDDKADADNTYTKEQVDDIVYGILPDDTASGSVANFATSLELPLKSLEVDVNAVQSAGTPTPASPLPIEGWSEISIARTGKNLLDESERTNLLNNIRYYVTNGVLLKAGTYTLSISEQVSGLYVKDFITDDTLFIKYNSDFLTFSLAKDTRVWIDSYKTGINTNDIVQLELGSTATEYEPYNGNTEVIELGGTYYGGHFTQDKDGHRQLVVTWAGIDVGTMTIYRNTSSGVSFFTAYPPIPNKLVKPKTFNDTERQSLKCSIYSVSNTLSGTWSVTLQNNYSCVLSYAQGTEYIAIRNDDYSDEATFKTAMNGVIMFYKMNEPYYIDIDLPDGEPIITLNGTNNIYADTGDCSVEYKCSVAEYVANHSGGGGAKSLGGVFLGGSNSGSEEEPTEESEETEKTKEIDEPKEEIKAIGDVKKLDGE